MEETNANVRERTKADSCRKPIRKRRRRRRRRRSVGDRPRENCSGNDWLVCCSSERKPAPAEMRQRTLAQQKRLKNKQNTKHKRQNLKGRKRRCASLCTLTFGNVKSSGTMRTSSFFLLPPLPSLFFSFGMPLFFPGRMKPAPTLVLSPSWVRPFLWVAIFYPENV